MSATNFYSTKSLDKSFYKYQLEEIEIKKECINQLHNGEKEIVGKCKHLSNSIGWGLPCGMLAVIAEKNQSICNEIFPISEDFKDLNLEILSECEKLTLMLNY
ncbi:hypothetical protein HYW20_04795 [Candidatus Woesearchaeota archaeon]|nr:hypothetical protein [Candidatus Woesearchaeota archaeon]